jgi:hypothetical protein
MAYDNKKVIIYGIVGVLLALSVIIFLPTHTETHLAPSVNLQLLQEYGIQATKISETPVKISNMILNIPLIEAKNQDDEWVQISTDEQRWDLWKEVEKTFEFNQSITGYSKIRFYIASGIDKSYVSLENGDILPLGVSSIPLEVNLHAPINEDTEGFELKLILSQGTMANYILPNAQIEISTNKITGEILIQ